MTCNCGRCAGSVEANSSCNNDSCCTESANACCSTSNTIGVPYYSCSSTCPEDNCQTITVTKTAGVFKTCRSFVMPACGGTVSVTFESITSLPIGAWMWSGQAGTFEVMGYDAETGIVQLKNLCPESPCANAAAPGATILNCTVFVLSAPGCNESIFDPNAPFPYLAADFVAPANGVCIQIAVTTTNGLGVNQTVSIAGGTYRIDSIDSPVLITICNDGAGVTPGTVVDHDDSEGNPIVPIVLIDSNPCSATPVLEAAVLGCNAGIVQPLTGLVAGQILVLNDPVTGDAEYQSVGIPLACCTTLTICLTLDPAFPAGTSYSATVASTECFEEGDLIQLGDPAITLYVDSIDGPTTMHVTPMPDPTEVVSYDPGTVVCLVDCCTILDYKLEQIFAVVNYADALPFDYPPDNIVASETSTGNICTLALENKSAHNAMGVKFDINATWEYRLNGDAGQIAHVAHILKVYSGNDPAGVPAIVYNLDNSYGLWVPGDYGPGYNNQSYAASFSGTVVVNVGDWAYVRAEASLLYVAGGTMESIDVDALFVRISGAGMAPYVAP